MSSKEKVKQTVRSEVVQNKSSNNKNSNSSKVYTVKETTVEKRIKRTYKNNEYDYTKDNLKQGLDTVNISKNKIPVSTANSKNSYQNKKIEVYEYSTQNISKNYTQDQNQEIYEKKEKVEKIEPSSSNKYIIETKKIETFKPRYPESSISLKKNNEIKQLMRNIWNYENQASQRDEAPTDTELKEANNENLPIEEVNDVNKELEINRENDLQEEKNEEKEEPNDEEIVENSHEAVLINKEVHEKEENIQDIKDNKEEEDPRENNEHYEEGEGEPEELEHNEKKYDTKHDNSRSRTKGPQKARYTIKKKLIISTNIIL